MISLPAPLCAEDGSLAADRASLLTEIHPGLLAPCCACGHTSMMWWRRDRSYYPLHERCIDRLIDLWAIMVSEEGGAGLADMPLTGAYARRAAAARATQRSETRAVAASSTDLGSPYFRPGMPTGAPWVASLRTTTGHHVVPCGLTEGYARALVRRGRRNTERGIVDFDGALAVGGCVVGPDGAVSDSWGMDAGPFSADPWETVRRVVFWTSCRICEVRMSPGCWRGEDSGSCLACLRSTTERPNWPSDPVNPGNDPAARSTTRPRAKRSAGRDRVTA